VELSRGRLVREPRPGAEHGVLVGRLVERIGVHARAGRLGITVAETGFLLNVEPPTVRGPDVAFLARSNLPPEPPPGFWTVAPDLAVEVLSPSDTAAAIGRKVIEYLEAGTRLVWIVDPATRTATIYRSRDEIRMIGEDEALDGVDVLPGFRLELAGLFETIGGR